ncbi:hypothetical protein KUL42_18840 [Alteromonas sp. KUL42]|uniref:hypothetical protein n=1 Tax=Alteromonas sp. KUL42 TaxID=2480797 RepID=UPI001035FB06|nr:hypothetical protein [Alteromonas sp. KUL42]TAP35635.1 hypothetical protein EYR97_09265 [Alteromonas sp. KUL42]GEA07123.1 hypothetical protein KUL42_18840 [Alteromonas sp. KUL42]
MFFRTLLLSVFLLVIKHAQAQSTLPSSIQHQVESQDVLVMVLGQPIAVADVLPSEDVRKQMREGANGNYAEMLSFAVDMNASNKVLEQLLNDYASKKGIVADAQLVRKFIDKFGGENSQKNSRPANSAHEDNASPKAIEEIAKLQVLKYLTEKSLYEEFGGTVIFRQSNPQMPIDAYRTLLSQYSTQGQLTFNDSELEEAFWSSFKAPFKYIVPAENVDFSQPWWL